MKNNLAHNQSKMESNSELKIYNTKDMEDTDIQKNPYWVRGGDLKKVGSKNRYCTSLEDQERFGYEIKEISKVLLKEYFNKSKKNFDYENLNHYKEFIYFSEYGDNLNLLIDRRNTKYNRNNCTSYICPEGHTDALALVSSGIDDKFGVLIRYNITSLPDIPENATSILFIRDPNETEQQLIKRIRSKYSPSHLKKIDLMSIGSEILGEIDISEFLDSQKFSSSIDLSNFLIKNAKSIKIQEIIEVDEFIKEILDNTGSSKKLLSISASTIIETLFEWKKNLVTQTVEIRINPEFWRNLEFSGENTKKDWERKLPLKYQEMNDGIFNSIKNFLSQLIERKVNSTSNLKDLIISTLYSSDNEREYNPFEDYFSQLTPIKPTKEYNPVRDLFDCMTLNEDYEQYRETYIEFITLWLGMKVRCALDEDYANEIMPILVGKQGAGKNYFIHSLIPKSLKRYFGMNLPKSKDGNIIMTNKMLVFDDELVSLKGNPIEILKGRLSAPFYTERLLFQTYDTQLPRRASIIGTTNTLEPLKDKTGNRRFIPIPFIKNPDPLIQDAKIKKLKKFDSDSLLAVGLYVHLNSKDLYIDYKLEKKFDLMNKDFVYSDLIDNIIDEYLYPPNEIEEIDSNFYTPIDTLNKFLELDPINSFRYDKKVQSDIKEALINRGYLFKSKRVKIKGNKQPRKGYFLKFR